MHIIYLGVGWLAGIWLAASIERPWWAWFLIGCLSLFSTAGARRRPRALLLLVATAGLGFGGLRYALAMPTLDPAHVASYTDTDDWVTLTGLIVDEPDVRDRSVNLRLRPEELTLPDGTAVSVRGDVLLRTARFPVVPYGARVELRGRLETPPEFDTFSYRAYLARQGIYAMISQPRLFVLAENQGSPLKQAIFTLKGRAQATIRRLIPDPEAALLTGILLGDDNGLSPELSEAFRVTGMTHIIAISGFNIAILIGILAGIGEPLLGKRGAAIGAVIGVALYTLLVGADASVVRAALMGGLYLFASRWLGRPAFAYASLFLAALLMTLLNPHTLWDVGFQLSFTATLGLMLYADPFAQAMRRWLARRFARPTVARLMGLLNEALLVTLAAQVLTLPLMVAYFGHISLISLPANFLILPLQPGVMMWGGMATLAGLLLPALGQLLAWIAWLFLWLTIWLVRFFAAVPGAAVSLSLSPATLVLIYALIAAITWLAQQPPDRRAVLYARLRARLTRRLALGAGGAAALLTMGWGLTQPDGRLHVVFFDVGQGDATFIQTPGGRQVLIDGGYYPSLLNEQLGQQLPFWDRRVDLLVATHPDADHVSGLVGVFDRYRVDRLITNGAGLGESGVYDAVLIAAAAQRTPQHAAQAGEVIDLGDGVRLQVLHPGPEPGEDRNENSVVLRLVYGRFSLLLTGDAGAEAEAAMLANGRDLTALVYKAGHHGANTSSSAPFLAAVRPQFVVVSAGADNQFGHPHPDVLARAAAAGAAVLRTDELGAFKLITDGRTLAWQTLP